MPQRFQHRRYAKLVARPSRFGNPFRIGGAGGATRAEAIADFRRWLAGGMPGFEPERRRRLLESLPELRGRDLGCYCRLDQECHADVLLELANRPER